MTKGRRAFAHDAVLLLDRDADDRAPGGAVTLALCGRWSHEPPCPLAPHHTEVDRSGDELSVRVLFAADPADEFRVRQLVDAALARGTGDTPDGGRASWRLLRSSPSPVHAGEREHAGRLIDS